VKDALPTTAAPRRASCGRYVLGDLIDVGTAETDGLSGGTQGTRAKPLRLRDLFQRDAAARVTGFLQRRES
jgi:hypothetical protein